MSRPKRDPLIAAMIAKLPDGEEWPVDRQLAWLHLMAMAFGTVYGGDASAQFGSKSPQATMAGGPPVTFKPIEKPAPVHAFYIDALGVAKRHDGTAVKPSEVKGEIFDLRGQDGDMKTIQWADGSTGLNGADLTIIAV